MAAVLSALCDCLNLWLNAGHSCSGQPVIDFIDIEVKIIGKLNETYL